MDHLKLFHASKFFCVSLLRGMKPRKLLLLGPFVLFFLPGLILARGRELVAVPRFSAAPIFGVSGTNPSGCDVGGKTGYNQSAPHLRIDSDVTVTIQRTDDVLYFCFQGVDKRPATPLSEPDHNDAVWVLLDVDDSDTPSPTSRDFVFQVSPTSLVTVNGTSYSGPTYASIGPSREGPAPKYDLYWGILGVDASDSPLQRSWHAELRIGKALLGNWHRIGVRLAYNVGIPYYTHRTRSWPLNATPTAPNMWATMLLNDDVAISSGVLTNNNNNARTGAYFEDSLTPITVNTSRFGLVYRWPVEGQIYTQPLYVRKLNMPDSSIKNVVYVATEKNWVYAFDVVSRATIWSRQLGVPPKWNDADNSDDNLFPSVGITSTPVIDLNARLIYLVAHTVDLPEKPGPDGNPKHGNNWHYFLRALDLATGVDAFGSPREITASVPGTGWASHRDASGNQVITFDPRKHLNRPALLIANGQIYVAFGSFVDTPDYHGWIMSYDSTSLEPVSAFNDTPSGGAGGIWQAGRGLVADGNGNIYLMTGNGTVSSQDFGTSFLRLTPNLQVSDHFLPESHACLNQYDLDTGSSGPLFIATHNIGNGFDLLLGGGKDGVLYSFNSSSLATPLDHVVATALPDWEAVTCDSYPVDFGDGTHHIHPGPVLWDVNSDGSNHIVYLMGENDNLKAWQITKEGKIVGIGMSKFKAYNGMPGGALSISYSGDPSTALVWAAVPMSDALDHIVPGMLIAFRAAPNGNDIPLLWNSEMVPGDSVGLYSKFAPPTIADGMIFLGSFGDPYFVDSTGQHNEDWLRPGWLNLYGFNPPRPSCDSIRTGLDGLKRQRDYLQQALDAVVGGDPGTLSRKQSLLKQIQNLDQSIAFANAALAVCTKTPAQAPPTVRQPSTTQQPSTTGKCDSIRARLDNLKRQRDNLQQALEAVVGGDPASLSRKQILSKEIQNVGQAITATRAELAVCLKGS